MTAKNLKNLAAQVRRTETALRQLARRLNLGERERHALLAAAAVLDTSGRRVGAEAIQAKRAEEAREKAIAKGTQEAMTLLADWPEATTLDKVALCIVAGLEAHLREDIGRKQTELGLEPRLLAETGETGYSGRSGLAILAPGEAGVGHHSSGSGEAGADSEPTTDHGSRGTMAGRVESTGIVSHVSRQTRGLKFEAPNGLLWCAFHAYSCRARCYFAPHEKPTKIQTAAGLAV